MLAGCIPAVPGLLELSQAFPGQAALRVDLSRWQLVECLNSPRISVPPFRARTTYFYCVGMVAAAVVFAKLEGSFSRQPVSNRRRKVSESMTRVRCRL